MFKDTYIQLPTDFTVRQTARILQISSHKVYALIHEGRLKSYKISDRGIRITEAQLEQFKGSGSVK